MRLRSRVLSFRAPSTSGRVDVGVSATSTSPFLLRAELCLGRRRPSSVEDEMCAVSISVGSSSSCHVGSLWSSHVVVDGSSRVSEDAPRATGCWICLGRRVEGNHGYAEVRGVPDQHMPRTRTGRSSYRRHSGAICSEERGMKPLLRLYDWIGVCPKANWQL